MNHGSEKRQRTQHLTIRFSADERAAIDQAAERAGLTPGSYVRQQVLGADVPRQVRRPPVERRELARLLGAIGHVGANLNQIAHRLNTGMPFERRAVLEALDGLDAVRKAVLAALGRPT